MGLFSFIQELIDRLAKPGSKEGKSKFDDVTAYLRCARRPCDVEFELFDGPLRDIPENRSEMYEIYGRPVKDKNPDHVRRFQKAKMVVARNLPGRWNNGSGKLYMLAAMEPYLREALRRCEEVDQLRHIDKMGCYNHRHIRFDENMPLSYHSWGAAIDINPSNNKARDKKKIGYVPQPFSKQWTELYPSGVSYDLVRAFTSTGFKWGGDWGFSGWSVLVSSYGVGYDEKAHHIPSWDKVKFVDPMHFELTA